MGDNNYFLGLFEGSTNMQAISFLYKAGNNSGPSTKNRNNIFLVGWILTVYKVCKKPTHWKIPWTEGPGGLRKTEGRRRRGRQRMRWSDGITDSRAPNLGKLHGGTGKPSMLQFMG